MDFIYGVRERAVFFGVGVCFVAKCGGGFVGLIDGVRERAAGGFERKTSEKTRVRALSGDVTGRGVQFKSKKKQFMRDAFTSRC